MQMTKNRAVRKRNDTSAKGKYNAKPKRVAKAATAGVYKGIPYDSLEEMAFLQWASELQKSGYIRSIQRAESYLLSDGVQNNYAQQLVTKSRPMQQTLLHGHSYTPEFIIVWDKRALDKIVWDISKSTKFEKLFVGVSSNGSYITYIEIKPLWDQNNMERLFKINQKWMWDKHGIFVNLVKCPELFAKSFTPQEYLTTKSGKTRRINWKVRSMYTFLKS